MYYKIKTASKLKSRTKKSEIREAKEVIDTILNKMESASNYGYYDISYRISSWINQEILQDFIKNLKNKGYEANCDWSTSQKDSIIYVKWGDGTK